MILLMRRKFLSEGNFKIKNSRASMKNKKVILSCRGEAFAGIQFEDSLIFRAANASPLRVSAYKVAVGLI